MSLLTEWEKRQQLAAHHTNWFQVKLEQSSPSHFLVAWCLAGQELQKEIKKLEEEAVERAWRCGCHITASIQISTAEHTKHQTNIETCDRSYILISLTWPGPRGPGGSGGPGDISGHGRYQTRSG